MDWKLMPTLNSCIVDAPRGGSRGLPPLSRKDTTPKWSSGPGACRDLLQDIVVWDHGSKFSFTGLVEEMRAGEEVFIFLAMYFRHVFWFSTADRRLNFSRTGGRICQKRSDRPPKAAISQITCAQFLAFGVTVNEQLKVGVQNPSTKLTLNSGYR